MEKYIAIISQLDYDNEWSVDKLQQYLIDQEDKRIIDKSTQNNNTENNNENIE